MPDIKKKEQCLADDEDVSAEVADLSSSAPSDPHSADRPKSDEVVEVVSASEEKGTGEGGVESDIVADATDDTVEDVINDSEETKMIKKSAVLDDCISDIVKAAGACQVFEDKEHANELVVEKDGQRAEDDGSRQQEKEEEEEEEEQDVVVEKAYRESYDCRLSCCSCLCKRSATRHPACKMCGVQAPLSQS